MAEGASRAMRAARELLRRGLVPGAASDARCGATQVFCEAPHVVSSGASGPGASLASASRGSVRGRGGAGAPGSGPAGDAGLRSEMPAGGRGAPRGEACGADAAALEVGTVERIARWVARAAARPRGAGGHAGGAWRGAGGCRALAAARGSSLLWPSRVRASPLAAASPSCSSACFSTAAESGAAAGPSAGPLEGSSSPPPSGSAPTPASVCGLPSFSELSAISPPRSPASEAVELKRLGLKAREQQPKTPSGRRQLALRLARLRLREAYPHRPTNEEYRAQLALQGIETAAEARGAESAAREAGADAAAEARGAEGGAVEASPGSPRPSSSLPATPDVYPPRPTSVLYPTAALATRLGTFLAESAWARDQALAIYVPTTAYADVVCSFSAWLGEVAARSPRLERALLRLEAARRQGSWEGVCGRGADGLPTPEAVPPGVSSAPGAVPPGVSSASTDPAEVLFPLFARFALATRRDSIAEYRARCAAADLRAPHTWYPVARSAPPRRVIYHAGPTNSGKTHRALEAMTRAPSGVYAGPLRLLAMEVYDATNQRGTTCDLVTGQERIEVPGSSHAACTVEMVDLNTPVDVAVLDEIQMLGDGCRGWAWTRALAGLPARELHLCGDSSAVPVVRRICEACGDSLEVRSYERLTPLEAEPEPLALQDPRSGGFALVRPGDCVVAFSRRDIFAIRREIELHSGHRACVIYGALPPETRRAQAARFNDPDSGRDVLVASDAVGMGLNLNIGRVVFSTTEKRGNDGAFGPVSPSAIKQIAGRAGRRRSTWGPGRAAALFPRDLDAVRRAIAMPLDGLETQRAGLFPEFEHLELFASQQPGTGFAELLRSFGRLAQVDDALYFLCRQEGVEDAAALLDGLELSLRDTYTFCVSPAPISTPVGAAALLRFARLKAAGLPVALDVEPPARLPQTALELRQLELATQVIDLWLWLAKRFQDPAQWPDADGAAKLSHLFCRALDAGIEAVAARERVAIERIRMGKGGKKKSKRKRNDDEDDQRDPLKGGQDRAAAAADHDHDRTDATPNDDRTALVSSADGDRTAHVSSADDDRAALASSPPVPVSRAGARDRAFAALCAADPETPFADPLAFLAGETAELEELQSRYPDLPRAKWAALCARARQEASSGRSRGGDQPQPAPWLRRGAGKAAGRAGRGSRGGGKQSKARAKSAGAGGRGKAKARGGQ